jgi:hypothetical protein
MTIDIRAFSQLKHNQVSTDACRGTGMLPAGFDSPDWFSKAYYLYRCRGIIQTRLGKMQPGVYKTTPQAEMLYINLTTTRFEAFLSALWDFAYEQLSWWQKLNPWSRLPFIELLEISGDGQIGTTVAQKIYHDFVVYEHQFQTFAFMDEKEKENFQEIYNNLKQLTKIAAQDGFLALG